MDTRDLAAVVHHVARRNPLAPIIAIGYSAGGHQLLRYLQDVGKETALVAAMVVSACFDFVQAVHDVEENENVTYRLFLDIQTRICAWRHLNNDTTIAHERHKYEQIIYEHGNHCLQLFDRFVYDLPTHSYNKHPKQEQYEFMTQTRDYYRRPALQGMDAIQVSTLILSALDDPIVHISNINWARVCENPNLIVMRTRRGGHVGWYEGILPFGDTLVEHTFVDFTSAVLDSHSHTNFLIQVMQNTLSHDSSANIHPRPLASDDADDDDDGADDSYLDPYIRKSTDSSRRRGNTQNRLLRPSSIARICSQSASSDRLDDMDTTVVDGFR